MWEDRLPNGEIGCQQPSLPFNLLLLQALQRQTQPWLLCSSCRRVLLQTPLPAAVQEQRQLRRGLRTQTAQRALGLQGDRQYNKDGIIMSPCVPSQPCLCPLRPLPPLPSPSPQYITMNTTRASYAGALSNHPRTHSLFKKCHQNRYKRKNS